MVFVSANLFSSQSVRKCLICQESFVSFRHVANPLRILHVIMASFVYWQFFIGLKTSRKPIKSDLQYLSVSHDWMEITINKAFVDRNFYFLGLSNAQLKWMWEITDDENKILTKSLKILKTCQHLLFWYKMMKKKQIENLTEIQVLSVVTLVWHSSVPPIAGIQ